MISVSFVNNRIQPIRVNDSLIDIFNTIKESENSINLLIGDYITNQEVNMMNEAVGLTTEAEESINSKKSSIFEKIGEFTLTIFKKIQEFIDKVIRAIKDLIYKLSPIEKKIEILKKENPEIANKILAEIDSGSLTMMDLKNLNEVEKMYNDILESARRKEIDSKTLAGKVEKFKNKFEDLIDENSETFKKVRTAGQAVTAVTAIVLIKNHLSQSVKLDYDIKKVSADWFDKARGVVNDMKETGYAGALDPDELSKAQIVSNINNYAQGNFGKIIEKNNIIMKILNGVMGSVLSLLGTDTNAHKFIDGIDALNNIKAAENKR